MKQPDISDIRKNRGPAAARAFMDSAKPFVPPPEEAKLAKGEKVAPIIKSTIWVWRNPAEIEPRNWLYGKHYIRGMVTATIGKRGGGKTNRAIAEMLSLVTGRDLLQTGNMPDQKQRVWYIGEDPKDEIERRIVAVCVRYDISAKEIGDRLAFDSIFDFPSGALKLATLQGNKVVPNQAAIAAIKADMLVKKIDVLILDPLKKFHGLREGDQEMDDLMTILSEIGADAKASVEFLHHSRKQAAGTAGNAITADDARGADAIIAGPRDVRLVNAMSLKEATEFGIPTTEAWRYARIDDGKMNLKPPGQAAWTRSASVLLPCKESIGVVETWKPPAPFEGISKADAELAQRLARTGAYRADVRSPEWFGYALGERLGLDPRNKPEHKAKIKSVIKIWLKNNVLLEEPGTGENRHEKLFIAPGPTVMAANGHAEGAFE